MAAGDSVVDIRGSGTHSSFRIAVRASAGRDGMLGVRAGAVRAEVSSPRERGRANESLLRLLSRALGIRKDRIEIVMGGLSREKVIRVAGMEPGELRARIDRALEAEGT